MAKRTVMQQNNETLLTPEEIAARQEQANQLASEQRIYGLEQHVKSLENSIQGITETLAQNATVLGENLQALEMFRESFGRVEAELAQLADRPEISVDNISPVALGADEIEHVRAVLARFVSDKPPVTDAPKTE